MWYFYRPDEPACLQLQLDDNNYLKHNLLFLSFFFLGGGGGGGVSPKNTVGERI
jgi:hypothetical protein